MVSRTLLRAADSERLRRWAAGNPLARRVALRFVAGDRLEDGIAAARQLAGRGRLLTLDLVGEHVRSPGDATAARDGYAAVLAAVDREALPAGISVKPSQLGGGVALELALDLLRPLAVVSGALGVHLTLDMEDHTTTEPTMTLVEKLHAEGHVHVGCAVQAHLHRTPADLARLSSLGASLRLCKGAYAEPDGVALQRRAEVDRAYASCATALLERGTLPRFATHDHRLIAHVRAEARRLGRRPGEYEFQMLYGVREELQQRLVDAGERLCVYVPFGDAWYPYFVRRLAERPANLVFLLRALGR